MNLRRLSVRTAAAGITTALAAGALVGLGTASADAATVSNVYTCKIDLLNTSFDTTLTATGDIPLPSAPAGFPVPANTVGLDVVATIDPSFVPVLTQYGVQSARADDFGLALGTSTVPIPLAGTIVTDASGTSWKATGKNKPFVLPGAGTPSALLPKAFTFTAVASVGEVPIPCALKAGQTAQAVDSIALAKQGTKTTAKVAKGKLTATVKGDASPATSGQVVVLNGKKVVGKANVKNGKAVIKLNKLKKGTYKLVASFKGNASFKASKSKKVTVKIK